MDGLSSHTLPAACPEPHAWCHSDECTHADPTPLRASPTTPIPGCWPIADWPRVADENDAALGLGDRREKRAAQRSPSSRGHNRPPSAEKASRWDTHHGEHRVQSRETRTRAVHFGESALKSRHPPSSPRDTRDSWAREIALVIAWDGHAHAGAVCDHFVWTR